MDSLKELSSVQPRNQDLNTETPAVIGRSGHCAVANDAVMFVYGGHHPEHGTPISEYDPSFDPDFTYHHRGLNELWKYNFYTNRWDELNQGNIHSTPASATSAFYRGNIWVFGGTQMPPGRQTSNVLSVYNVRKATWSTVECSGDPDDCPPRAYGQSLVFRDNMLYVFTGAVVRQAFDFDFHASLHCLDLETRTWRRLRTRDYEPEGRYKQEMVYYKNKLYIIGGGNHLTLSLRQIEVYDLHSESWTQIPCIPDEERTPHREVPFHRPQYPMPRAGFGCAIHGQWAYIFGGKGYLQFQEWAFNDIWRLCLETYRWEQLPFRLPMGLGFLSATLALTGEIFVYGGNDFYSDIRSNKLLKIRICVARLSELCFQTVASNLPEVDRCSDAQLLQLGIPYNMIHRLQS